jgi:hypothetical protein
MAHPRLDSCCLRLTLIVLLTVICNSLSFAQRSTEQTLDSLLIGNNDPASIKVFVLGTFHFTDAPNYNAIDKPRQQKEIEHLVESLSTFNPTKILLEYEHKEGDRLDSLYQAYQAGNHNLNNNERQQIGFRLAHKLNHSQVYAVDYKKPMGMGAVMKWAKKNEPEFLTFFRNWRSEANRIDSVLHHSYTISEILSFLATDKYLKRLQEARMRMMEVGAGKNYIGVEPAASVYKRNMRIFANIMDVAEPGDRLLIVYGSGHSYFFNNFVEENSKTKLVDPQKYLNK